MPRATVEISHRLRGRLIASPGSVLFGEVRGDGTERRVVELRDGGVEPPFVFDRAVSDRPDIIRVVATPVGGGVVSYRLEVTVGPSPDSGGVAGSVTVFARDSLRAALVIPVQAYFLPAVRVTPTALVLPRRVGGARVYAGECVCRSTRGDPVALRLAEAGDGLTVEVRPGADDREKRVRVRWSPPKAGGGRGRVEKAVRLTATAGGKEYPLKIQILCLDEE